MPSLQGVLAGLPGIAGFEASRQQNDQRDMSQLQQMGALQKIMAHAQAQQEAVKMRGLLSQSGGDPEKAMQAAIAAGHPEAAAKLAPIVEIYRKQKADQGKIQPIGSGGALKGDGTIIPPAARPDQQRGSGLARLISERDALPQGDPRRAIYDNAIRKESETAKQISPTVVIPKPDRVPIGYRLKENGDLEPIPGGPADTKLQGALNQDTANLNESQSAMDRLQVEANRMLNHPGLSKSTGLMSIVPLAGGLATVPGTDAANFKAGLDTLKSQVGFSVLQQMRNNSKTGGALGQISDRENLLLQQNLAALDRAQSESEFKAALGRIIEYTEGAKNRLRNAYNLRHSGKQPTTLSPAPTDAVPSFATEAEAIKSGVKGKVIIGGRPARID